MAPSKKQDYQKPIVRELNRIKSTAGKNMFNSVESGMGQGQGPS